MKTLLLKCAAALLISGLIFSSCKKNDPSSFGRKGVINLDVLFTCNNCPGGRYDVVFANDTTAYHIGNDLTPFGITPDTKLPINVSVSWKPDSAVASNFVIITALKIDK